MTAVAGIAALKNYYAKTGGALSEVLKE